MKIVTYYRVSSKEHQKRQWNSIDAQRERVLAWAHRYGHTVLKEFEDRDTGTDFNRIEFRKMWQFCRDNRSNIDAVICAEVTRFGREGAKFLEWFKRFKDVGIEVNFADEWIDFSIPEMYGIFYYRIGNAEAESLRISKRTKATKETIRASGYYADTPPAPWVYGPRNAEGRKELIPSAAFHTYRIALKAYLDGDGKLTQTEAIQKALVETGVKISTSTFSRLLRSPLIAGYISTKSGQLVQGKVQPLVSWAEYQSLQKVQDSPTVAAKVVRSFNPDFPLKKMLICPCCGAQPRAYWARGRRGQLFGYYDCGNHWRVSSKKAHELVGIVLGLFFTRPGMSEIIDSAADTAMRGIYSASAKQKELSQKELVAVRAQIELLKKDYAILGAQLFSEMLNEARSKERDLVAAIDQIDQSAAIAVETRSKLIKLLDNLSQWYQSASPDRQYQLLNMIFPRGFSIHDGQLRTPRLNNVFQLIAGYTTAYELPSGKGDWVKVFFVEAEEEGFEPPERSSRSAVFKTAAINRSATPPLSI